MTSPGLVDRGTDTTVELIPAALVADHFERGLYGSMATSALSKLQYQTGPLKLQYSIKCGNHPISHPSTSNSTTHMKKKFHSLLGNQLSHLPRNPWHPITP